MADALLWGRGIFLQLDCKWWWDMAALSDGMQERIHGVDNSQRNSAAKV